MSVCVDSLFGNWTSCGSASENRSRIQEQRNTDRLEMLANSLKIANLDVKIKPQREYLGT